MDEGEKDFPLPRLRPGLKLTRAPDADGAPAWTLHDPITNSYYRVDWATFECLARFPLCRTAIELRDMVVAQTTVNVSVADIGQTVLFMNNSNLLAARPAQVPFKDKRTPLWKSALSHYLYFTIPLFRPQEFLERALPRIAFMFSRGFITGMLAFLGIMLLLTLPRADEFAHSFSNIFSIEGAIATFLVLTFVKIAHEFAHAFTAVRNGVRVPHMGLAFMVMYPVLYTETTGAWQLSSRRARFHIAVAGITAELILAGVFLALWHILPPGGMGQTLCFLVVAVSLVGSLAINLNPLMRFDGYYMLSDLTGIDNLQQRAIAFARWTLRRVMFGLTDAPPEDTPAARAKFLTRFGIALLIYRFFLFLGIALLVYHLFFQPLGLILCLVELGWFIALPVWNEMKIWHARRAEILSHPRGRASATMAAAVLLLFVLPWRAAASLPAVLHAGEHMSVYAPAPAQIKETHVKDGETVAAGDLLMVLSSPALETKIAQARQEMEKRRTLARRGRADPSSALRPEDRMTDEQVEQARIAYESLVKSRERLTITAPFDGVIADADPYLHAGRFVTPRERLFNVINPDAAAVTGYVSEDDLPRLRPNATGRFHPGSSLLDRGQRFVLTDIAGTDERVLGWPELAARYGGTVTGDEAKESGGIVPRQAVYRVTFRAAQGEKIPPVTQVITGRIDLPAAPASRFINFIKDLVPTLRQGS